MISETKQINETLLDELVEEICALLHAGKQVDLDRLAAEHPDLADQLRKLYPTLLTMTSLAESVSSLGLAGGSGQNTQNQTLGDFQIVRQIGRGGMGVVYEAQQLSISRKVALKVLPLAALVDHRALQRFKNEVAAIATLEHPHIVSVYSIGEDRGIHYFAMQLIHGQSLAAVIRELRTRADQDQSVSGDAIQQAVSDMEDSDPQGAAPILVPSPPLRGRGQGEGANEEKGSGLFYAKHPEGRSGKRVLTPFPDAETRARGRSSTVRQIGDQTYFRNVVRLILQAADALQHAHDHGIVHRDVKPGNLLLDTHGSLFVTDFGLARIEAGAGVTMTGDVMGTLRYMSPEQILGNRVVIDHRTDVYSLGATLYELLTLQPVWSGDNRAELLRQISFEEPTRPQKISPAIPNDLETIVLKAISKNPNDRYDNAQSFADDLSCFLDLKPIVAKRPTAVQRLAKWTRRNPTIMWSSVAVLTVVIVSLTLGIIGLSMSNSLIRAEQAKTKARVDDLNLVSEFQSSILEQIDPSNAGLQLAKDVLSKFEEALVKENIPEAGRGEPKAVFASLWKKINATDAARELINQTILKPAVAAIDKQFANQPILDAQLRQTLAQRYIQLGSINSALPLQESALSTRRRLLGNEHADTLNSINKMGDLLLRLGKSNEAEAHYREALETCRRVLGNGHRETMESVSGIGVVLFLRGKFHEAEPYYEEAYELCRQIFGDDANETLTTKSNLARLHAELGKTEEAEISLRELVEKRRQMFGDTHIETLGSMRSLSSVLIARGKLSEAEKNNRDLLENYRVLRGEDHLDTINAILAVGKVLARQGKRSDAELYFREALEKQRRVLGDNNVNTATTSAALGELLWAQGKLIEAESFLRDSLEKHRRLLGDENRETLNSINNLGLVLVNLDRLDEAEVLLRESLAKRQHAWGKEHRDALTGMNNLAGLLKTKGNLADAEGLLREAVDICRRVLDKDDSNTLLFIMQLGSVLNEQGKHSETVDLLAPIEAVCRTKFTGVDTSRVGNLLTTLGKARMALSEFGEAEANLLEAWKIHVQTPSPVQSKSIRNCNQALIDLYAAWHSVESDKGHDITADEWRKKLDDPNASKSEN